MAGDDIYAATDVIAARGPTIMLKPPMTCFERSKTRVAGPRKPLDWLARHGILIDGDGEVNGSETKILLQICSRALIGRILFEFIQRKGDDGFGEGSFRALFESTEQDQIARAV